VLKTPQPSKICTKQNHVGFQFSDFDRNTYICSSTDVFLGLLNTPKMRLQSGLTPVLCWRRLQRSPEPSSWIWGAALWMGKEGYEKEAKVRSGEKKTLRK